MTTANFPSSECAPASMGEHDEIASTWAAEAERRIDEYDRGEVSLVDVDEAIAAAHARIRRVIREE